MRIAALGKKGSISELLKTLGAMTPDERKEKGPSSMAQGQVTDAIAAKHGTEAGAIGAQLATDTGRCPFRSAHHRPNVAEFIRESVTEKSGDLRRHGLRGCEGPDIETDFNNFTHLISRWTPRREMHDTSSSISRMRAYASAHQHLARAIPR